MLELWLFEHLLTLTSPNTEVQDLISSTSDLSAFSYGQLKLSDILYSNPRVGENNMIFFNNDKQIFHAFLFNIRNYSPKVINIQRQEEELNIILSRVNNFDIKQKKAWNICFVIWH